MTRYTRQTKNQDYADPALQEAVVTLFISQEQHDPSLPGRLLPKFPDLFSKSRYHPNPFWEGLHSNGSGPPAPPLVRLENKAESFFLQYGQGILSLHSLKPYGGFPYLKSACQRVVDYICESDETFTVDDCSLLYFNKFQFPEKHVSLPDYFSLRLNVPNLQEVQPAGFNSFTISTDFDYPQFERTVRVDYQSGAERELRLSLECRPKGSTSWNSDTLTLWLEESHDLLADIFESSITDKARELMGRIS